MTPKRHAQIRTIFLDTLKCPIDQREIHLEQVCGDDVDLRREVEALLLRHRRESIAAGGFLHESTLSVGRSATISGDGSEFFTRPDLPQAASESDREFEPGFVIAGRYRIVSLLGRGGMGEVYRADDLTLNHAVALKFLPRIVSRETLWISRLQNEARMAREVTHTNVCRIYDIDQHHGDAFISMEYVDGEDLASLLRRIGRVPRDKALDIARHICFGLAAAHVRGVLHRDLKPSNIMLDRRGRTRITDFGLAILAGEIRQRDIRIGTPAYMAPEQLAGKALNERSDIYALGLVLYELFTGQRAFAAERPADYIKLQLHSSPRPPSSIVQNFDPDIERVILWCLERDPAFRPASALAVAAALPGGDMLAGVLAAGETPSPELVAAAGDAGRFTRSSAAMQFAAFCVFLLASVFLSSRLQAVWHFPGALSREALIDRAHRMLAVSGIDARAGDESSGFDLATDVQKQFMPVAASDDGVLPVAGGTDASILFWYRHSPGELVPNGARNLTFQYARVQLNDPPAIGTTSVIMDAHGRLVLFRGAPNAPSSAAASPTSNVDWTELLRRADVNPADVIEAPLRLAPFRFESRVAWTGHRRAEDRSVQIEAAAFQGQPVFFGVFDPDAGARNADTTGQRWRILLLSNLYTIILLLLFPFVVPIARRHFRSGHADRRGASRIAAAILILRMVAWVLYAHHIPNLYVEIEHLVIAYAGAAGEAVMIWTFYLALEPYVRQFWPHSLIGWTRFLYGRFSDPLVARNILLGTVVAAALSVAIKIDALAPVWLGWSVPANIDNRFNDGALVGISWGIASSFDAARRGIYDALSVLLIMVALRVVLRRPLVADIGTLLLFAALFVPRGSHPLISGITLGICGVGVVIWVLTRHGLLAAMSALSVLWMLRSSPLTLNTRSWFFDAGLLTLAVPIAIAILGFILARRSAFVPRLNT